jgi:hypothetical protein
MTRFFIDQTEVQLPPMGVVSLKRVLQHVEERFLGPETIIRAVQVDGLPLALEDLGEVSSTERFEHGEKVEIVTGNLAGVALDSVDQAISYLEHLEPVIVSLGDTFQVSPGPDAFARLKELLESFYWLNLLLDRLGTSFNFSFDSILVQGGAARELHQRFADKLKDLVDAQEMGDFVSVSDLLKYEMLPSLSGWKDLFGQISVLIEGTTRES